MFVFIIGTTERERHTEGDSPLDSSPLKLHRRSFGRKGCSIRTMRRSAIADIRRLLLMFNRRHMHRAYLFLALCLIEVVLLYAGLYVSIGILDLADVSHLTLYSTCSWVARGIGFHVLFKALDGGVSACDLLRRFRG
jgi:hypothetical protein